MTNLLMLDIWTLSQEVHSRCLLLSRSMVDLHNQKALELTLVVNLACSVLDQGHRYGSKQFVLWSWSFADDPQTLDTSSLSNNQMRRYLFILFTQFVRHNPQVVKPAYSLYIRSCGQTTWSTPSLHHISCHDGHDFNLHMHGLYGKLWCFGLEACPRIWNSLPIPLLDF